jgi:hypothetical protein
MGSVDGARVGVFFLTFMVRFRRFSWFFLLARRWGERRLFNQFG